MITLKRFMYSVSALTLTLQFAITSEVLASKKGQGDMDAALSGSHSASGVSRVASSSSTAAAVAVAVAAVAADDDAVSARAGVFAAAAGPSDGLAELLFLQDYPAAFSSLKTQVGNLPAEDIVEFLVTSNGYPKDKWIGLSSRRRTEIVDRIVGGSWGGGAACAAAAAAVAGRSAAAAGTKYR